MTTTPRCVLCGRPEDEATPSFSTYLHAVGERRRCPECGKPQGADLVDRAEVEGELADLRAENAALREARAAEAHHAQALRTALCVARAALVDPIRLTLPQIDAALDIVPSDALPHGALASSGRLDALADDNRPTCDDTGRWRPIDTTKEKP